MLVLLRLSQGTDAKKASLVGDGQLVYPQGCRAGVGVSQHYIQRQLPQTLLAFQFVVHN